MIFHRLLWRCALAIAYNQVDTREGSESFKHPSYSPDGRQIVFYSNKTGKYQLWIVNVDGSNQRLLFESSASCWDPAWLK